MIQRITLRHLPRIRSLSQLDKLLQKTKEHLIYSDTKFKDAQTKNIQRKRFRYISEAKGKKKKRPVQTIL